MLNFMTTYKNFTSPTEACISTFTLCQDAVSKTSKKKSAVMSQSDWSFLDSILTPYYCRKVEMQVARADAMQLQLVSASETEVTFKVWVQHGDENTEDNNAENSSSDESTPEGDDSDNADFASDSNESDAPNAYSDDDVNTSRAVGGAPISITEQAVADSEDAISSCGSEGLDDFKPFKWRRVRTVTCTLEGDNDFIVNCDCGYMNRTCIICRHIFRMFKAVLKSWGLQSQSWHRRMLKKFYCEVITTLKAVGGSAKVPLATIPKDVLQAFCASVSATSEGVPSPGLLDDTVVGEDTHFEHDADFEAPDSSAANAAKKKKKKRKSHNDCVEKFTTIMYDLKGDGEGRDAFYGMMSQFQIARGRGSVSQKPGAPERDRTRGLFADKPKGSSKPKKHAASKTNKRNRNKHSDHSEPEHSKPKRQKSEGYNDDAALRHLKRFGAKEGWILECYPKAKSTGRWFMRVENGLVTNDFQGNVVIRSCRWLEENSLTEVDTRFKPEPCDIQWVKAYGPSHFFVLEVD